MDNLFVIAHASVLQTIKLEEDWVFLLQQRGPEWEGYLIGVARKLAKKEERARQRKLKEEERQKKL